MRIGWTIFLGLPTLAMASEQAPTFDAPRAVLEVRCLECHTQEKAKRGVVFTTREGMIRGGEGGCSLAGGRGFIPEIENGIAPPGRSAGPADRGDRGISEKRRL